ncbi:MAG TPA: hypothetical protein VG125_05025 [Pirellulales bacterium]|nr:hypothetical protein [Pirellulales bacterium]
MPILLQDALGLPAGLALLVAPYLYLSAACPAGGSGPAAEKAVATRPPPRHSVTAFVGRPA